MITYNLTFEGFKREAVKNSLPESSGLYFVYRGRRLLDRYGAYYCVLNELLYIGMAHNIRQRVCGGHESFSDWESSLVGDEILYYSSCLLPEVLEKDNLYLERAEAACIFKAAPRFNDKQKGMFDFDKYGEVRILSEGRIALMDKDFTLKH